MVVWFGLSHTAEWVCVCLQQKNKKQTTNLPLFLCLVHFWLSNSYWSWRLSLCAVFKVNVALLNGTTFKTWYQTLFPYYRLHSKTFAKNNRAFSHFLFAMRLSFKVSFFISLLQNLVWPVPCLLFFTVDTACSQTEVFPSAMSQSSLIALLIAWEWPHDRLLPGNLSSSHSPSTV